MQAVDVVRLNDGVTPPCGKRSKRSNNYMPSIGQSLVFVFFCVGVDVKMALLS